MKRMILLAFILALSLSGYASGAATDPIMYVTNSIPSNYPEDGYDDDGNLVIPAYASTLQEALEKSDEFVSDVQEFENVRIILQKNDTLEETVELDGSNYSNLKTITIAGSGTRNISAPESGGRHFLITYSGVKLILSDINLIGNSEGGGINISDGEAEFTSVTFRNNAATEEDDDGNTTGGAVLVTGNGKVSFTSCTFSSNTAGTGGAIYTSSSNAVSFAETNTLSNNTASVNGGAIYIASGCEIASTGTLTFTNNTSEGNGGAIYASSGSTLTSTSYTFSGNTAAENGGAIYAEETSGTIRMTITGGFTSNTATSGNGGAICLSSGSELELSGTVTFNSNKAPSGNGGAIYAEGTAKITNSSSTVTFRTNSTSYSSDGGDNEASDYSSGYGGAVCMLGTESLAFGDASFISNTSPLGGAVYISSGTISFSGSTSWNGNKAYHGGALYTAGGTTTFAGTAAFTYNEALDNGGALYVTEDTEALTFSSTPTFTSNKANTDEGTLGDGGAIWWGALLSKFPSSGEFNSNSTAGSIDGESVEGDAGKGGAIYIAGTTTKETLTLTTQEYTFVNNTAFNKGGAIYTNSENVDIVLTNFELTDRNTAQYYNGGFLNSAQGKITVEDGSVIRNQQANMYGGAIYGKNIEITDSIFENNISVRGHGGAIYAGKDDTYVTSDSTGDTSLNVESSVFRYNKASDRNNGSGGAITAGEVKVTVNNSYFEENAAGHSGGAIYLNQGCTDVKVTSSTFKANGTDGSQVNAQYGGAIRTESPAAIETSYFYSNSAQTSGGAVYFNRHSSGSAAFSVKYSMFRRNVSVGSGSDSVVGGGALYLDMDTAAIDSSTFDSNVARGSSGVMGGAVYIYNLRESNIQNSTFTDNQVTGTGSCGGGIAIAGTSRVNVTSCTITASSLSGGNTAVNMGGGIYVSANGNMAIGGTIVVGNSANYGGDIAALGECSSTALGFNRVGKFSGDSSTGSTPWTSQPNRAETDRSNESWTKETFFGGNSQLSDNRISNADPEQPPLIGSNTKLLDDEEPQIWLQTIMLSEDITLANDDRATNIIETSYAASFPRYDERGADRWETGIAMDIGAVRFDGTIISPTPGPVTSYTVQSIMMSGIPNTLRSIGQTASLIALIRYTNGRTAYGGDETGSEPVTWSSSNQNLVRIDQKGNITALAITPNNSYVTIKVSTNRNTAGGSPATDSRPVRVLGQYSYLNVSSEYQNYLSSYVQEIAEHDIAIGLGDVNSTSVKSSSFQKKFKEVWGSESANLITEFETSTPELDTVTGYTATGYTPSRNAAPVINFQNRSNGDLCPLTYTWMFSGSEIKSLLGYDLSEKTINAKFAEELFEALRVDFQGAGKTFQVIGGSGVSAKDAFTNRALTLIKSDGNRGVNVELTVCLANVTSSGSDNDGPQLIGAGSRQLLIVPDGTNDSAISGAMWMMQKGSSSSSNPDPNTNPDPTPNPGSDEDNSGSGGGGGGGCYAFNAGILALALVLAFRKR